MARDKFVHYTLNELKTAVERAICWTDVCREVDVSICTYNFKRMQKLCEEHNISTDHFDRVKAFRRNKKERWTADTFFVENCTIPRCNIRNTAIRLGMKADKCESCGIDDNWNGSPLTIEIDHINGIHTDNRRENLRWLCPNCHSQTKTYRRRTE